MRKIAMLIAVLFFSTAMVFAQNRTVSGKVNDPSGNGIPYATITVKGTKQGVTADEAGIFLIKNVPANATLTITGAGFNATDVDVTGKNTISVALERNSKTSLQEVVVTALGVSKSKEKLGYSATTFKSEDINRVAPVSALDGLQGKVAGADISTIGGQPGASSKAILRGYGSLGRGNQALVVVDGVPFNNDRLGSANGDVDFGNGLNDLNPNDIDNISFLKGAAATSLYGSRAQAGAIIITTKKGRSGKLKVDFTSSAVFSSVQKLPTFQDVWGQGWNGQHYKEENGSWGPKLDGAERLWGSTVDNSRLIKPFSAVKNNVRDFYDQGIELNNTIALRGGNENTNFYFSYGNVNSDGVLPGKNDVYYRNTVSLRGQTRTDKLTISSSFNYINKNSKNVSSNDDAQGSSTFENIIQIPRDFYITDFKDYNNKFFNVDNYFTPYAANPYFSLYENGNNLTSDRFFGNIEFGYKLSSVFDVKLRAGGDFTNARLKQYQAIESPATGSWRGPNPTNFEGASYTAKVGSVTERSDYSGEINTDLFLNYNKKVSTDFDLSGFVGFNFNQRSGRSQVSSITGLTIPGFYDLSNSANNPTTNSAISKRRLFGLFGQVNLGYKDFLFLSLNARNDWSSTLPIDANTFFYPGANLSLVLSKLADMSALKIDYLKLRAAYGRTGNDAPLYSLYSTLVSGNVALGFGNIVFPINGIPAFELGNQIGNNKLKPEITTETEFGLEAKLFDSRFGIDLTYYNKISDGQILGIQIAPSTGYTTQIANFGKVRNRGIELAVNVVPVRSKNFNWNINYTYTRNRNAVITMPGGLDKIDFTSYFDVKMVVRQGQPIGIIEAPTVEKTEDGKYITENGFYKTTAGDFAQGNVNRDFIMGLNNTFEYKGWRLGFTLDYRKGGSLVSRTADLTYFVGNAYQTQYNDRRPFIIPNSVVEDGVDANGKPVYAENTEFIDVTNYNSYWYHTTNKGFAWQNMILSKSFLKLRDVTLSYSLSKKAASKIKAESITLSLIARNFLIWTPKENTFIDPEVSNLGNDLLSEFGEQATSPSIKSFGASLKIGF